MAEQELAIATDNAGRGGFGGDAAQILDTPRTRQACQRLGLVIEDLQAREFNSFYIPGDLKEKQTLRFNHYEKRRKERLAQVLAERAKVIAINAKKGEVPGVQSGQFLGMLESLFEKEAKRLENDLKSQLRQHSSLVKENEEQLQKEQMLQHQIVTREQRRQNVEKMKESKSKQVRELNQTRQQTNSEAIAKIETEFEEKQIEFARTMLAEEERLERFQEEKAKMSSDKAEVFRAKVEGMKQKNRDLVEQKRIEGEARLLDIEARINAVSSRREEDLKHRELRSQEQHLHMMDVREQKSRIDRVDQHRRSELKEQIDENMERIETLLALKENLLDQRKARTTKAEATKGSRGLNLRRDCLPGPGQYELPPSCLNELPSTKIGHAQVPGLIDAAIKGTKANPPPGAYDTAMLPGGDRLDRAAPAGVQFGDNKRTSFLDDAMAAKAFVPAPGRYEIKHSRDPRAPSLKRAAVGETILDKKSATNYPVWARPGTDTPGPAGYSIDDYGRKEVLRRAQKSLPNLTRDMLRPGKA